MPIKLISGYSNPGGSTVAHINLTNFFNENGLDCTFYGPNDWHLNKCKAKKLQEFSLNSEDHLIVHYLILGEKPQCKKTILSCHETDVYVIKTVLEKIQRPFWDQIHYVSRSQMQWQGVEGVVIPNVPSELKIACPIKTHTAGIIGSIDQHKRTHISIDRAKADGWKQIILFGAPTDPQYFVNEIYPRLSEQVVYAGHIEDKQKMYDLVDVVYHSSQRETFNYVQVECKLTGTEYRGLESASVDQEIMSKSQILEKWKNLLND